MVVSRDISICKSIKPNDVFHRGIIEKNTFSLRRLKSIPLIYVLKTEKEEQPIEQNYHEQNVFNNYIKNHHFFNKSIVKMSSVIKEICTTNYRDHVENELVEASDEINVANLIHQISYETSRSYRLSENFRRLLFRHFEGYEDVYLTNNMSNSYLLNTEHHESHVKQVVTRNSFRHLDYKLIDRIYQNREQLNTVERLMSVKHLPNDIDYEKRIHTIREIMNTPIYYTKSFDYKTIERINEYRRLSSMNLVSMEHVNRYMSLFKTMDHMHVSNLMELSTTLNQIVRSDHQSNVSWILKTLSKSRSRNSRFNTEYKALFTKSEPKTYNMITYNNIIQESNQITKNLSLLNEMISVHTKERETELRNTLTIKTREEPIDPNSINPFHISHRKDQNKIVTNLLGMISNEMSKNIAVRNMMNNLVVNTESVSEISKSDMKYNKMYSSMKKSHTEYNSPKYEHVDIEYKETKKIVKEEKAEEKTEVFNSHEYVKKTELYIEPSMLTERTVNYLSQRLIENIETKQRRDYERRGRH